ncbi:probable receptor-like protein kinase At1g33260 isoform X1 [Rhodamnia argentea]|uniref:Probable receptor-like protein kinase At1g33260 isoform X1 n=1 Tax=Rhodamnia argentea TaxID=178133 RepID=A0A8B8QZ08_9MYRT|nr:probable receptor-like protein kinase At1g33260 isoform X1 [Rhodamnia argentea]
MALSAVDDPTEVAVVERDPPLLRRGPFLSGCCRSPSPTSSAAIFFFLLSLQPAAIYGTDAPGTPARKEAHFDPRVAAPLIAVFSLLGLGLAMGVLTLLHLWLRRGSNGAVVAGAEDQERGDVGNGGGPNGVVGKSGANKSEGGDGCCAKKYRWEEVQGMTMEFSRAIGSGGFSTVYLATLDGSSECGLAAVKVQCGFGERLSLAFKQELEILLRLRHENIVKLLGYCDDRDAGALVFEYVPSGNLQEKLHGNHLRRATVLPWSHRVSIAFQLAQAIEYLHEKCALQIVHGDVKSSNVLLDEDLNCKLCDFGSAKMGFSSLVLPPSSSSPRWKQIMMGSPGYTDPHYLRTGIASKKNDIYSYGVVVLELVTGMEAFCEERGLMLTSIAASLLGEEGEIGAGRAAEMVDPRLSGKFEIEEVKAMVDVARLCMQQTHTLRPSATHVLEFFRERIPSAASKPGPEKKCLRT